MMDDENQRCRTANLMELTFIDHLGHLPSSFGETVGMVRTPGCCLCQQCVRYESRRAQGEIKLTALR